MEISYKKNNNVKLFKEFEKSELLNMNNCQNFIPLYKSFFTLNENNYNSINLNNKYILQSITKKKTENIFDGILKDDDSNNTISKTVFFKLCPLLDPFKYLAGKYDVSNSDLFNLPKFNNNA